MEECGGAHAQGHAPKQGAQITETYASIFEESREETGEGGGGACASVTAYLFDIFNRTMKADTCVGLIHYSSSCS